jgi:8-oxo-dGTP pyrophosphatase MutT (NUDIX family)
MSDLHSSIKGVLVRDSAILLIQYWAPNVGEHYNLPGGRQRPDESAHEALHRKFMEEAGAEIDPGPFLFFYEYIGKNNEYFHGDKHSVSLVFRCFLKSGSEPSMDRCTAPDVERQTGVVWVPFSEFFRIQLFPRAQQQIMTLLNRTSPEDDRYLGDII